MFLYLFRIAAITSFETDTLGAGLVHCEDDGTDENVTAETAFENVTRFTIFGGADCTIEEEVTDLLLVWNPGTVKVADDTLVTLLVKVSRFTFCNGKGAVDEGAAEGARIAAPLL